MKQPLIIIIICFTAMAFGIRRNDNPQQQLVGRWTEHWGKDSIDPESDVDYVDTITIAAGKKGLEMRCHHDSGYVYDKIRYKGDSLFFRMQNIKYPETEAFFVDYALKQIAADRFEGRIHNSKDQTVSITLKKLPAQ